MKIYGLLGIFALLNMLLFNYFDSQITHASVETTPEQPPVPNLEQSADKSALRLQSYESHKFGWQVIENLPDTVIDQLDITPVPYKSNSLLLSEATCARLQSAATEIFEGAVTEIETPFREADLGLLGINCQLIVLNGEWTAADDYLLIADAFKHELEAHGWLEDPTFIAYGPTETTLAFTKDNNSGLLHVGWQPVPHTNCVFIPSTAICQFKPELRLYTVTFEFTVTPQTYRPSGRLS